MREKLRNLLNEAMDKKGIYLDEITDYLLTNGVIVLPIKVEQIVYVPWRWNGIQNVAQVKVEEVNIYDNKNNCMFLLEMESDDESFNQMFGGWKTVNSIGKTVFLTKEEAENALEGTKEN